MPESLGFPQKPFNAVAQLEITKPESKGRYFIGLLLLLIMGFVTYSVWNAYFRYKAYAVVSGRLINVSSPVIGTLQSINVKEGDKVKQGQLLATVENVELRQKYNLLHDDLMFESANLTASLTKLKLEYSFKLDNSQGTIAVYTEVLANLAYEEARVIFLEGAADRARNQFKKGVGSENECLDLKYQYEGQKAKVVKLNETVVLLKARVDQLLALDNKSKILVLWEECLHPHVTKIEMTQNKIKLIQQQLSNCFILSPVTGTVVKNCNFSGETISPNNVVFVILEDKSECVILYVPQEMANSFNNGRQLELTMAPNSEKVLVTVQRRGDKYELPPEIIKRYYNAGQHLLPIYCVIGNEPNMCYNAVLKLPYLLD